jgi:hypothetical protein
MQDELQQVPLMEREQREQPQLLGSLPAGTQLRAQLLASWQEERRRLPPQAPSQGLSRVQKQKSKSLSPTEGPQQSPVSSPQPAPDFGPEEPTRRLWAASGAQAVVVWPPQLTASWLMLARVPESSSEPHCPVQGSMPPRRLSQPWVQARLVRLLPEQTQEWSSPLPLAF